MNNPVGTQIGDYQILKVLGAGGMGRVYQVRNSITDRIEAMKVLLPDLQGKEELATRFQREIKVLAALNHPNIAPLLTACTIDNQLVMIMEYVEGESLSARLNSGAIPVLDALNYTEQVLNALAYAHQRQVIHRDIKPANMMLTPQGIVKLMDFGVARTQGDATKLTMTGSTLGSVNYMSPEQIHGRAVDGRSDLYSLGISLYEMVTGERPFKGDNTFVVMAAHLTKAPAPPKDVHPGLPPAVNDLILTSLAKAPEQRWQSAEAFREAVQRARQSLGGTKIPAAVAPGKSASVSYVKAVPDTHPSIADTQQDVNTLVQGSLDNSLVDMGAVAAYAEVAAKKEPGPPGAVVQSAQATGHRGLYISLGALIVVLVLVAAGIYMPTRKKASAAPVEVAKPAQQMASPAPQEVQPAPTPATPTDSTQATTGTAADTPIPPAAEKPKPSPARTKKLLAQNANSPGQRTVAAENIAPPGPSQTELDETEHEIDQLSARAAAVNNSLDNFQRSSGYGLRGDMVAKQSSMKINLARAQDAIGRGDLERAKKFEGLATSDVEALEKFLGR